MKKILLALSAALLLTVACAGGGPVGVGVSVGPGVGMNTSYFYDYLAPYGTWVELAPYGYVWQPAGIGFGWRPYTFGQWLWTDDGWFWDSSYEWGWIPFHYGRWGWDADLDWYWVPGDVWGPAWVTWCWSDAYVGWAPLPPGVAFGLNIGLGALGEIPFRYWCFVDGNRFLDRDLDRVILPFERNRAIFDRAVGRGNLSVERGRVFDGGIGIDRVRQFTDRQIQTRRIETMGRPGRAEVGSNAVRVYRPEVGRAEGARPRTFIPRNEAVQRQPELRMEQRGNQAGRRAPQTEQALRQRQSREAELMRRSQQNERQALQRQHEQQMARAANQAERSRMNQEFEQRSQQMQQRHRQEMDGMAQRHQQEMQRFNQARGRSGGRRRTP
jgi:hypothetical protein